MDLKELLGEELYTQVAEKLGDKKVMVDDGNFIPKARFDEVNNAKKELDSQLKARDKQLKDLETKAQGNDELLKQISDLQVENKKSKEEYEARISKISFDNALDKALTGAKVRNTKALKALLDMEGIEYKEDSLVGLDEQLNKLKETESYLFEEVNPGGSGFNPGGTGNTTITKEQFSTMSYFDRVKLKQDNPNLYEELSN